MNRFLLRKAVPLDVTRLAALSFALCVLSAVGCGPDFTGEVLSVSERGDQTSVLLDVESYKSYETDKVTIFYKHKPADLKPGVKIKVWLSKMYLREIYPPHADARKIKIVDGD